MTLSSVHIEAVLREALSGEFGITVNIESTLPVANRTKLAEQMFYNVTKHDAAFRELYIGLSPDYPDTELWIIHKSKLTVEAYDEPPLNLDIDI